MIPQVDLFLFVFWKKLKTPERHFKINWALASKKWSNQKKKGTLLWQFALIFLKIRPLSRGQGRDFLMENWTIPKFPDLWYPSPKWFEKKIGPLILLILIWKLNGIYYSVFLFWLQTQRREKFDYAVTIFAYGFLLLHLTPSCHKWAAQLGYKVSVLGLRD